MLKSYTMWDKIDSGYYETLIEDDVDNAIEEFIHDIEKELDIEFDEEQLKVYEGLSTTEKFKLIYSALSE